MWLKSNCYFGNKFCRTLKENITCRNVFQRLHVDVSLNTYYIKSSQIASARKVTFPSKSFTSMWKVCVSTCTTCSPWISNLLQIRSDNYLFLGFKTTIKKYHHFQWYQASCCELAFSQRDFQQCIIKRSTLEQRYYVPAELKLGSHRVILFWR